MTAIAIGQSQCRQAGGGGGADGLGLSPGGGGVACLLNVQPYSCAASLMCSSLCCPVCPVLTARPPSQQTIRPLVSTLTANAKIDILPRLKARDSSYYADRSSSWGSRFTGRVTPSPPRAVTACPAAMLIAAFTSALQAKPQAVHRNTAWLSREPPSTRPPAEHR